MNKSRLAADKRFLNTTDQSLIDVLNSLEINYWDFLNSDTKKYTHGIHNYPAMMVAPISENIIRIVKQLRPVNSLFDPFAGSGTVLVEAMLAGIPDIYGTDINPLALMLSNAKITPIDNIELTNVLSSLIKNIESEYTNLHSAITSIDDFIENELGLDIAAKDKWGSNAPDFIKEFLRAKELNIDIPDFKNIGFWFRPRVILELQIIKTQIQKIENSNIRNYAFAAFSETIRLVSNKRNGEFKLYRMTAEKIKDFLPNVRSVFLDILLRNQAKMADFTNELANIAVKPNVRVVKNNACSLEEIPNDFFDLIITSPPYGDSKTTVAYGQYSRLSLQWLDIMDPEKVAQIDKTLMGGQQFNKGYDSQLKSPTLIDSLSKIHALDSKRAGDVYSFYNDLDYVLKAVAKKTKKEGYQFWVVGNRTVKGIKLCTDAIIAELAEHHGLVHIHTASRNIPNKVMPLKNSPTNQTGQVVTTMTNEHIVVLKKI